MANRKILILMLSSKIGEKIITAFQQANFDVTATEDANAVFSFDLMSFAWDDDTSSWLFLESFVIEELTLNP